jgi:hypothetical protein
MGPVKYLVCPGIVKSVNDGQHHYIGPNMLMHLYGVKYDECKIYEPSPNWLPIDYELSFERNINLIKLYPRSDGNYKIPEN